jgi:DNA polymerase theta
MLTTLDWNIFHTVWPTGAVEQHVAHLVGVNGMVVYKKAASLRIEKREYEEKFDGIRYARFFIALILNDLLLEKSLCDIIRKYECTKSFIQQLQQTTATFTCIVQIFAERLSWKNLKQLLNGFQSRLNFGIKQELCELIRISILNACRARQLYSDGFTTLSSLANGDVYEIERSIQKAVPFQTYKYFLFSLIYN